ncbi:MAG: hypothetical protein F6K10_26270 [Moorea sp. SIO2B7]|nr:hypothetical protein [Moorena sp. SIO2B7]
MMRRSFHSVLKFTGLSLLIIASMAAVGFLQKPQLEAIKKENKEYSLSSLNQELEAEQLKLKFFKQIPAFGFDNLLADWVFIKFLLYFGDDKAREMTGYQLSPDYFEVIINSDTRFQDMYLFLSTSISLYAAMPERSVALMEKGLQSLSPTIPPKAYYIWRYKGIDELLFLGDGEAAKKSFQKSAEWASDVYYSDQESKSVAELSRTTAEFLAENPDSKKALVAGWTMVLQKAVDERTRKTAIKRIEELGGKVIIDSEGQVRIQMPEED